MFIFRLNEFYNSSKVLNVNEKMCTLYVFEVYEVYSKELNTLTKRLKVSKQFSKFPEAARVIVQCQSPLPVYQTCQKFFKHFQRLLQQSTHFSKWPEAFIMTLQILTITENLSKLSTCLKISKNFLKRPVASTTTL